MAKQVLSSLQEDFEAIGLAPKSPPSEGSDGAGEVDEAKRVKTKRMTSAQKAKERKRYKGRRAKIKKYRKTAKAKKAAKKRAKRVKAGKVGKGRMRVFAGLGSIANIMSDVKGLMDTLQSEDRDEALASFANVAIISDLLSRGFAALSGQDDLGEDVDSQDLEGASETFTDLAAFAAEVATALKSGDLEVDEKLQAAFKEAVEDMLEGLEVFVALTEDEDDDSDSSDDSDDDSDSSDDSTDEDTDDDSDDDSDDSDDDTDDDSTDEDTDGDDGDSTDEDCDDCDDDAYAEMRQRLGLGEG